MSKRKIDELNRALVKEEGIKREAVNRIKQQRENGTSTMNDPDIVDLDGVKVEPNLLIQKIVKTEGREAAQIVNNLVITGELPATDETRRAIQSVFGNSSMFERTLSTASPHKLKSAKSYARENDAYECSFRKQLFAQGTFKNVYKGIYVLGERRGQNAAVKVFKSGSVFEASFFDSELDVVEKAMEIINQFNAGNFTTQRVWLNRPQIWTEKNHQEKCLVEPMIENFQKFNSNTGWRPDETYRWIEIMQALSHFSYHASNTEFLLCDLQGGISDEGFIITDPVVISQKQIYGPSDLGSRGISTFFARHKCNQFCKSSWKTPAVKQIHFKAEKGTTMVLPSFKTESRK